MATAPPLIRTLDGTVAWPCDAIRPVTLTRPPLDLTRITRDALVIIALLLVNKPGNIGAGVFFAILAGMVLWSPRAAFQALAICWLGLMINTAFVPKSLVWTPARLILPLLAFVRFSIDLSLVRATLFASPMYLTFVGYVLVMAVCSIVSGWFTQIALIKLANFWAVVSAILAGVTVLRRLRIDLTEWFVSLIAATTLLGVASIVLGVDSNFRGTILGEAMGTFNGAFLHPNCHSVYASLFTSLLMTVFLIGEYPRRKVTTPAIAAWIMFMVWSKARAAALATTAGFFLLLILAKPLRNRFGLHLHINVQRSTVFAFLLLGVVALTLIDAATRGSVSRTVIAFAHKTNEVERESLDAEKLFSSRQGLIDLSLKNFRENPLFGIGFQVSTDPRFTTNATLFTAPVEKGVIITAVLEEGGVIGATAFVIFLLVTVIELRRARNIPALVMLATFLTSNLGEVTFFSPGGSGAFGWTMIGAGMILGDHCWKRGNGHSSMYPVPG